MQHFMFGLPEYENKVQEVEYSTGKAPISLENEGFSPNKSLVNFNNAK